MWSFDLLLTDMWSMSEAELCVTRVGLVITGNRPKDSRDSKYLFVC